MKRLGNIHGMWQLAHGRRIRWASLGVAFLLSWHAAVFAVPEAAASCCCKHNGEKHDGEPERLCHCPVCTHARESAQAQPSLRGCGSHAAPSLVSAPQPFLAHLLLPVLSAPRSVRVADPEPAAPDPDSPEVPTPPPLG
jgi:hypothetical protein